MTVAECPVRSTHDSYRFGPGPGVVLQPGTLGWSIDDLNDSEIRTLWERGRYEIINGVLTLMPAARFRGGSVVDSLKFVLRAYLAARGIRAKFASEVDVAIEQLIILRPDAAVVFGDDRRKFESLRFNPPETDWRDHALTLPPTLIVESVSRGHEKHDLVNKRKWYAEFGVPHYWIVDAYRQSLDCLRIDAGAYVVDAQGTGDETLQPAAFPGLVIPLRELWND